MASIDFAEIMKNKTDYLDQSEINKILQYFYDKNQVRNYMLILTLVRTGRRISEIVGKKPFTRNVGFRPCDIRPDGLIEFDILKKGHVKSKTKSGSNRTKEAIAEDYLKKMPKRKLKPVDDEYLELIKTYIESEGIGEYDRIFPITRQWADKLVKIAAKKCNIYRSHNKIHCHNFRHSMAINILKKNKYDPSALIKLKDLLEHSSLNVTLAYTQFTQDDKKEILERTFGEDKEE
jgi:integrase